MTGLHNLAQLCLVAGLGLTWPISSDAQSDDKKIHPVIRDALGRLVGPVLAMSAEGNSPVVGIDFDGTIYPISVQHLGFVDHNDVFYATDNCTGPGYTFEGKCLSYGGFFPVTAVTGPLHTLWVQSGDPTVVTVQSKHTDGPCETLQQPLTQALVPLTPAVELGSKFASSFVIDFE